MTQQRPSNRCAAIMGPGGRALIHHLVTRYPPRTHRLTRHPARSSNTSKTSSNCPTSYITQSHPPPSKRAAAAGPLESTKMAALGRGEHVWHSSCQRSLCPPSQLGAAATTQLTADSCKVIQSPGSVSYFHIRPRGLTWSLEKEYLLFTLPVSEQQIPRRKS